MTVLQTWWSKLAPLVAWCQGLEYGLAFTTQELGLIQSIGYDLERNCRLVQFLFAEVYSKV